MLTFKRLLLLAAFLLPPGLDAADDGKTTHPAGVAASSPRVQINLGNSEWKFIKEDLYPQAKEIAFDDSQWKSVGIPHSYNDSDTYVNDGSGLAGGAYAAFKGTVWYRKHFKLPEQYRGKKIFVEFDGVNIAAAVYINGKFIPGNSAVSGKEATHVHGFIGFVVDVTDEVRFGGKEENVLAVRVGNEYGAKVESKDLWYRPPSFGTSFAFSMAAGGIVRPVNLIVTDRAYIPLNVYSVVQKWGTHVATISADEKTAQIQVKTNIENEYPAQKPIELTTTVLDAEGKSVLSMSETATVGSMKEHTFTQTGTIANPQLWYPASSPYGKPYLYKVLSAVKLGGKVVDTFESPLGIRTITWDEHYPYINGKKHELWGFGQRYEYPALSMAVPEEQQWRDIKLITECGGRFLRPGHSASTPITVDACDAYGVMIAQPSGDNEGAVGRSQKAPGAPDWVLKTELHRDLMIRDRNHPSILAWETDNGGNAGNLPKGGAAELLAITKQWDDVQPRRLSPREHHFNPPSETAPGEMVMGFCNGAHLRAMDSPVFRRYEMDDSTLDKLANAVAEKGTTDGTVEQFIWNAIPPEIRKSIATQPKPSGGSVAINAKRDAMIAGLNGIVQGAPLTGVSFFDPSNPAAFQNIVPQPKRSGVLGNLRRLIKQLTKKTERSAEENQFMNKWLLAEAIVTIDPTLQMMLASYRGPIWNAECWITRGARHDWDNEVLYTETFANEWRNEKEYAKAFAFAQWYIAETSGESCTSIIGVDDPLIRAEMEKELRAKGGLRIGRGLGCSAMDGNRIPKLIYRVWQNALWIPYEQKPGVTLQSHWNYSGTVDVNAWSNCPKVELFINGVSKGARIPDPATGRCLWEGIAWESGILRAEGKDAAGKTVSSDQRVSAGKPDRIILTVEPPLKRPDGGVYDIRANGSDAGFVLATIVDEKGNWCPLADDNITFAVTGPADYRGSYNFWKTDKKPVPYHSPGDPELQAEGGQMKVAIRSTFEPGEITVTASAPGLKPGSASFKTVPVSKLDQSVSTK